LNIYDYEIKESPDLSTEEKETILILDNESASFYSDKKPAIKWAIERLKKEQAELINYHIENNYLTSIHIKISPGYIKFQKRDRKNPTFSSCF
jgi:hypothetical protein